jgi:hypothetical protein
LVFTNESSLQQVLQDLGGKSDAQLDIWENGLGFTSVRSVNKVLVQSVSEDTKLTDDFDLPNFYASIVNEKGEFQIGDTVVFLNGGQSYYIPTSQESSLKTNGTFNLSSIQSYPKYPVTTTYMSKSGNTFDARYQFEYDAEGRRWKIVYEVAIFHDRGTQWVYFRMKLERRHKRKNWKWDVVNNPRRVFVNNLISQVQFVPTNTPFSRSCTNSFPNVTGTTYNGNYEQILCYNFSNVAPTQRWNYNVSANLLKIEVPAHLPQGQYTVSPANWYVWY